MTFGIRDLRVAVCLALGALTALALASNAESSPQLKTGIQSDFLVLHPDQTLRDSAFASLAELKPGVLRINLLWYEVAPVRPAAPRDPNDPEYRWERYDRAVVQAQENGIEVLFTILGTPSWANGGRSRAHAPASGTTLRDFAYAAATRYSGAFSPDGVSPPLPKVFRWTAWNEPNLSFWLRPLSYRRGRHLQALARAYARICNAVHSGVHQAGAAALIPKEIVACGVTAPVANYKLSYPPLTFLRAIKAAGARFDVYAHNPHPRRPTETPYSRPRSPRGVLVLGNIDLLLKQLTRSYGARKRVWLTEYAYQTKPEDPLIGVTWAKQATLLKQAYAKARKLPRIDMLVWFLLWDEPDRNGSLFGAPGWQSGLMTHLGAPKPAFAAFKALNQ